MRKICVLAATVAALSVAPASFANFWMTPIFSHSTSADIDGSSGDMSSTTYGLMGGNDYFTLGYKSTDYSYSGNGFQPFDDLSLLFGDAHYEDMFTNSVGYFIGAELTFGWEDDVHLSDDYSFRPRAGLNFVVNQDVTLLLGGKVNFNEADDKFTPILGLKYRDPSDMGFYALIGYPQTDIQYRFNNYFAAVGSLTAVNQDVYQLADDNKIARKGYVMEDSYNAKAGIVLTPMQSFTINAGVDLALDRDYDLYNSNGDKISTYSTDPALGAYVNFDVNF